jgi:hypothetical protein
MSENIDKILERGEKLEVLVAKTSEALRYFVKYFF